MIKLGYYANEGLITEKTLEWLKAHSENFISKYGRRDCSHPSHLSSTHTQFAVSKGSKGKLTAHLIQMISHNSNYSKK